MLAGEVGTTAIRMDAAWMDLLRAHFDIEKLGYELALRPPRGLVLGKELLHAGPSTGVETTGNKSD